MDGAKSQHHSHLFTLRVWDEGLDGAGGIRSEWRARLQNVTTGEMRYLRDWATVLPLLLAMLAEGDTADTPPPPGAEEQTGIKQGNKE